MSNTPQRRRIMRTFKLSELSTVDRPAQKPAQIMILKRDEETSGDVPGKRAERIGKQPTEGPIMADKSADSESAEITKRDAEISKRDETIAKLEQILNLSAEHRAHFDTLPVSKQDDFLTSNDAGRDAILEALEKSNPVVFTGEDGTEYRKSDDPRLVKMAKDRDEDRKVADQLRKAHDNNMFAKQAEDTIGLIPAKPETRIAVIRKVSEIEEEEDRNAAFDLLQKANEVYKYATQTTGSNDVVSLDERRESTAEDVFNRAVRKCAQEDGINEADATRIVASTPAGKALYAKVLENRRDRGRSA